MGYIETALLPPERVILKARIHWVVFLPALTLLLGAGIFNYVFYQGAIGLVMSLMAIVSFVRALIYFFTTELVVTDQRVIAKFGLIMRSTYELNVDKITSLNVDQSILGRLLDYGNIRVIGMGGTAAPIPAIMDPIGFRRAVLGEVR